MYLNFYGFKKEPFQITPDPEFLFLSPSHKEAMASIIYGIEGKKGFVAITGSVGVGKTTILRSYLDKVNREKLKIVYIFNANVSFSNLLKTIYQDLGIAAEANDVFLMVNQLHQELINIYKEGYNVVLIIDEAQNMPIETLENLRMLSNLETATEKLIQIVIIGQPEFEEMINRHELRQLKQRIAIKTVISRGWGSKCLSGRLLLDLRGVRLFCFTQPPGAQDPLGLDAILDDHQHVEALLHSQALSRVSVSLSHDVVGVGEPIQQGPSAYLLLWWGFVHHAAQAVGHLGQQPIGHQVAVRRIDKLEEIEVREEKLPVPVEPAEQMHPVQPASAGQDQVRDVGSVEALPPGDVGLTGDELLDRRHPHWHVKECAGPAAVQPVLVHRPQPVALSEDEVDHVIVHEGLGKPVLRLHARAKPGFTQPRYRRAHVSRQQE